MWIDYMAALKIRDAIFDIQEAVPKKLIAGRCYLPGREAIGLPFRKGTFLE